MPEFRDSHPELDETADLPRQEEADADVASQVVRILDDYLAQLKAGQQPDREALLAEHPELAHSLQACLAGLEFIHGSGDRDVSAKRLGDFEIIREIGRGGMGAVYEARQISLGRKVALKVMRFGAVSDPDAVERFQREAETVACLHHTNVVPIFAVGVENGVHYYAMQYIVGRSLDQFARSDSSLVDGTTQTRPIAAETVVKWGLQAAEALSHAHARGVIHRDVKPSNLLIDDAEGRIWLTDFGLAKRSDDVTLSMTGALLGTPRYMSPEQASATRRVLDHRTDIYSLGATLYELATGTPVFTADSPHEVISQILSVEPKSARARCPSLPRDLDTILMKCLSKDATQRYKSAADLADDLRAFIDGRPIAARRAGAIERASRWVKRQERNVKLTAAAIVGTVVLIALATTGLYAWHRMQLASMMLRTEHPPLVVELRRGGERTLPPFTVPTGERREIDSGKYQMRVLGAGRLSDTIDVDLSAGQMLDQKLNLEKQLLWKNVDIAGSFRLVPRQGFPFQREADGDRALKSVAVPPIGIDLIELNATGIRCLHGLGGWPQWELNLAEPKHELLTDGVNLTWPWNRLHGGIFSNGLNLFDSRPWVIGRAGSEHTENGLFQTTHSVDSIESVNAIDLNRDGHTDMLLAARHQAWILAVNGRDGTPLWLAARGEAAAANPVKSGGLQAQVLEPPRLVPDQNDDGVSDVVASFIYNDNSRIDRWIELLSGDDGVAIWRYDLAPERFQLETGEKVPDAMQWYYIGGGGRSGGSSSLNRYYRTRRAGEQTRQETDTYRQSDLYLGPSQTEPTEVSALCGKQFVRLELATGTTLPKEPPADVGLRTVLPPRFADLDDDGSVDLLLVEQTPGTEGKHQLVAWSSQRKDRLWQLPLDAELPFQFEVDLPPPDWPLIVDLEQDGSLEILVPGKSISQKAFSPPWGHVHLIDGRSGTVRWTRQIFNADRQLSRFIDGPDIDNDGVRDICVASQWGEELDLYVDALSGRDGRSLWRLRQPLLIGGFEEGHFNMGGLAWYEKGLDGWPQLIVPLRREDNHSTKDKSTDRLALVSSGTGNLNALAVDVSQVHIADLDGDGTDDLLLVQETNEHDMHGGAKLHAVHGVERELWHELLPPQMNVGDIDGDGVGDLIPETVRGEFEARSGASGRVIWRSNAMRRAGRYFTQSTAQHNPSHRIANHFHDLNRDGVPDVLLLWDPTRYNHDVQPLLVAVSGADGDRLWQAEFAAAHIDAIPMVDVRDLNGDGEPEVVIVASVDYGQPTHVAEQTGDFTRSVHNDPALWLAVLSGNDGKVVWTKPLTEAQPDNYGKHFEFRTAWVESAYGDLNGDGTEDLLLPAQRDSKSDALDMLAIDGESGQTLWRTPLTKSGMDVDGSGQNAFGQCLPAACGDLNGDGRLEAIVMSFGSDPTSRKPLLRVSALHGDNGQEIWHWDAFGITPHGNAVDGRIDRLQDRLRPLLARRSNGKQAVALLLWNQAREIFVIDEAGQTLSHRREEETFFAEGERIWILDADHDQQDELLFINHLQVSLLPIDRLDQPLWERRKVVADMEEVIGILPSETSVGRIVVAGGSSDHSLRGLDATTGRTTWSCTGPAYDEIAVDATMLTGPTEKTPPVGLFQADGGVIVRQAGSTLPHLASWNAVPPHLALTAPGDPDPRLLRPLPWVPSKHEYDGIEEVAGWIAFYALAFTIIPVTFLYWVISRRRWGMKTLLLLPVIGALMGTAAAFHPARPEFMPMEAKLLIAVGTVPVIVSVILFARWWRQGKRRYIAYCVLATLLVALCVAALSMHFDSTRYGAFEAGERFDLRGWYYGLVPVVYWIFYVPFLWLIVTSFLKTCWLVLRVILPWHSIKQNTIQR
ncbi:MAG: protein kinase [Pirellulaceae bacterium]